MKLSTSDYSIFYTYTCTCLLSLCRVGIDEVRHNTHRSSRNKGITIVVSLSKDISSQWYYYYDNMCMEQYVEWLETSNIFLSKVYYDSRKLGILWGRILWTFHRGLCEVLQVVLPTVHHIFIHWWRKLLKYYTKFVNFYSNSYKSFVLHGAYCALYMHPCKKLVYIATCTYTCKCTQA